LDETELTVFKQTQPGFKACYTWYE